MSTSFPPVVVLILEAFHDNRPQTTLAPADSEDVVERLAGLIQSLTKQSEVVRVGVGHG